MSLSPFSAICIKPKIIACLNLNTSLKLDDSSKEQRKYLERNAKNSKTRSHKHNCQRKKDSLKLSIIKKCFKTFKQKLQTAESRWDIHSISTIKHRHEFLWVFFPTFLYFFYKYSVCLTKLWMDVVLIDLHHHVLLLNLEGYMNKNTWWPINLQLPCCSAAVPARRISKFILLEKLLLFSFFRSLEKRPGVQVRFGGLSGWFSQLPNTIFLKVSFTFFIEQPKCGCHVCKGLPTLNVTGDMTARELSHKT